MKALKAPSLAALLAVCTGLGACRKSEAKKDPHSEAARTYAMVCARCHGPDGSGKSLTPMATPPRNFRDAAFHQERSDGDLAGAIRDGKGAMPAFRSMYDAEQIAELVAIIRSFNPKK
jgi:mono/diheme cytochrome c family protein